MMRGLRSGSAESGHGSVQQERTRINYVCYTVAERILADLGLAAEEEEGCMCWRCKCSSHYYYEWDDVQAPPSHIQTYKNK
jgi:hypothetical protein